VLTGAEARNILRLSLIVDDSEAKKNDEKWYIYYHLYLDKACQDRLRLQAKKLYGLCCSMEAWRESKYGKLVRFCNYGTLMRVGEV
jgi:hypothetical protein